MMGKLFEQGELPYGLEVNGQVHKVFQLRAPTVQDNIDAINEVGTGNAVELSLAIFALQLVMLGYLVHDKPGNSKQPEGTVFINTDLLRQLHPADFNELERASARLEKKLLLGGSSSSGGRPAEQLLPATE